MVSRLLFLLFMCPLSMSAFGQLNMAFFWGKEPIELGKTYPYGKDSIRFDELKMYLSDFCLKRSNRNHVMMGAHLIDLSDQSTLTLFPDLTISDFESMSFQFGLDSSYHVSDIVTGDLDPLKGMYWAWNSGYIQFKCTGQSTSKELNDRSFEFHLGGYRKPLETMVSVSLIIHGNDLILDLQPFFEQSVHFTEVQRIMIPSTLAKKFCQDISLGFYSK